ncbi:hypothetical protein [Streptomyces fuscichromogenes]|uniref:hypothetical protein n=1 Tax=Streptomyces fuscichromogenes TaxID=1324013 RepID=UPI0016707407|nr:hypothetical protein [Streptomyces fuscichromogenes]
MAQGTAADVRLTELVRPTLDALAELDVLVIATPGRAAELAAAYARHDALTEIHETVVELGR